MEPRVLILETSGRAGSVALAEGKTLLCTRRLDETRRHARDLAPAVRELFRTQGWKPRDVQAVFVSRGPGSYTGLRIGITSAKVFAYATGCALIGIDTFSAIAMQVPLGPDGPSSPSNMGSQVDVLADAQQDKIYVQRFLSAVPQTPLAIVTVADWLVQPQHSGWVTGSGMRVLRDRLPATFRVVAEDHWDPRPESLLCLGLERFRRGERDAPFALEPCYLRPSSAEEKWAGKKTGKLPGSPDL